MEVSQWIQRVQEKECQLSTEVESQGFELEQVVIIIEQHLKGPVNDAVIQEFVEKEAISKKQVEASWAKLEAFKAELIRPEWLGMSHRWVLGAYWPLTKFWEHLVIFNHFWDFDSMLKMERKTKQRSWDLGSFLGIFGVLGIM